MPCLTTTHASIVDGIKTKDLSEQLDILNNVKLFPALKLLIIKKSLPIIREKNVRVAATKL